MPDTDIRQTDTTELKGTVQDYNVNSKELDSPEQAPETFWDNRYFAQYNGYFKTLPEVNANVTALSTWTCGKGWKADIPTQVILENIVGNGKQNFQSIMEAHQTMKKVNGDAYTQIIRSDSGTLINLKLLNPSRIKVFFDKQGIISRYEQLDIKKETTVRTFKPKEILHSINEPFGDEIHGYGILEAAKWVIDAKNEAMSDWRRILHRSTIRVLYVDEDDTTKLNTLKTQYADAIKNGEVLILPIKKSEGELTDITAPPIDNFMQWIRYLDNFIYTAVKIPRIITGGTQEHTEASAKIGYITFEPVYTQEQLELEADLWNQAAIRVKFNRPAELGGLMQQDEAKNTGQVALQPNDTEATITPE